MAVLRNLTARLDMRRGLRLVLIAQAVVAALLVLSDFQMRWLPRLGSNDALPSGPVEPGDQVRRYDPARTRPDFAAPATLPALRSPEALPPRLEFSLEDTEQFGQFLLITGPIRKGDAMRLDGFLSELSETPDLIALHSPGGSVAEALAIGRKIRALEADAAILPGAVCLSACPYVLAGGVERRVTAESAVGMHQSYYETPGYLPAVLAVKDVQRSQGRTMEYLIEMGVDPGLMLYSLNTPPNEIYVLVEEELIKTRLATTFVK